MGRFRYLGVGALGYAILVGSVASASVTELPGAPEAVSPAAEAGEALVEARCPAFSWAGVEGANGYELVVLAVSDGEEIASTPQVVSRIRLAHGARSWTPSLGSCLERGGRYAWSVRALTEEGEGLWSRPALFRLATGPSVQEVEAALETLRRHLGEAPAGGPQLVAERPEPLAGKLEQPASPLDERVRERIATSTEQRAGGAEHDARRGVPRIEAEIATPAVEGDGIPSRISMAAAPVLGQKSLSVSANVALGSSSNVFKGGAVFLWDDATGNTALGRSAMASATGTNNTAVGWRALQYATAGVNYWYGSSNTAVGDVALRFNTSGFRNTASGALALNGNTTGHSNTVSGFNALTFNSSGAYNTASGAFSLRANTTGSRNTGSGAFALHLNSTGSHNTASGSNALRANTTGNNNTASGDSALLTNTTGINNTASGISALRDNADGNFNTAHGGEALISNTSGFRNTASGFGALRSNTTGLYNTAIGVYALRANTEGSRNVALGDNAGVYVTGAGRDNNIFISSYGVADDTNKIRIGTQATQDGTFIAGIHGVTVTGSTVFVSATGQLGVSTSSAAFKENVEELGEVSERLAALRPVTFRYRSEVLPDGGAQVGLLAEEVDEIFPELVTRDAAGRAFGVRYDLLSVVALAELQQQVAINRAQGTELAAQLRETAALRERVAALEADETRSAPKRRRGRRS